MRSGWQILLLLAAIFGVLIVLHAPFLRLPYFWDEAGYYIPASLDFYRYNLLIPRDTLPTGHTPLVMIYLGVAWRLFSFSTLVTRVAMILIAAATVLTTFTLGRRVAGSEAGIWGALLLSLSPLFFAQSSLAFLDLTAAWFTTLALFLVLEECWLLFAFAASAAVMSKETAVVMLPVVWAFVLLSRSERRRGVWVALFAPLVPLAAWAVYYHHTTGFWTGNASYLKYNVYATLTPLHFLRSLLARLAEVFVQGFNWVVAAGALLGVWLLRKRRWKISEARSTSVACDTASLAQRFAFLAIGLIFVYVLMLSLVGGAILPRYLLPVFPVFYIGVVALVWHLPREAARAILLIAAACFVSSWFINPPYPFPYEDNLAYADFIRLHQQAAKLLETLPGDPVILTSWPATDELKEPFLGYVDRPLRVAAVDAFTPADFRKPPHFDVLYLYSRQWEPGSNLLMTRWPLAAGFGRFFDYRPAISPRVLSARFHLTLLRQFTHRGQWVRIYATRRGSGAFAF